MYVDTDAGVGYRNLADQVNKMDAAVKGEIRLELLTCEEHDLLGWFLQNQRALLWENATEAVWSQWLSKEAYAPLKAMSNEAQARRDEIRHTVEMAKG